jgi:hypothetical protein
MMIEQSLRRSLRRTEPSRGFAERTVAHAIAEHASPPSRNHPHTRLSRRAAIGLAASLTIVTAAGWWHMAQREAEAERARQDVELALRITSEKLLEVQSKVQAKMARLGDPQF